MRINTNLISQNTYLQYTKNNNKIANSVEKLSSGYSINSASDNAAGLSISEKMRAQIRGLDQASSNSQDAISLVQTAEGSLSESTEILQRMREIAVQSSSDTNENKIDRSALQDEFSQLQSELNDIATTTSYNKKSLLDGSLASTTKSVDITKLTNATTAVSVGNAKAGNYSFTVSVQQETSAVAASSSSGTASRGTTAKATIDAASVTMGGNTKNTALYNGNYTLKSTVDSSSGSITVTATGDNGQAFNCTLNHDQLEAGTSLALNFETAKNADDSFKLNLTLASTPDADSTNSLETLASAINDVTVSVSGGVDAVDATYGAYANCTGGTSVKLNAGDTSVTFDNGVTVSFDALTATDVAVGTNDSDVLVRTGVTSTATMGVAATSPASIVFDFSGITALSSGSTFALQLGDKTYSGTYKGETGADLQSMLTNVLAGSASQITDDDSNTYTMSVDTAGKATYTANANTDTTGITVNGISTAITEANDGTINAAGILKSGTGDAVTYTPGNSTTAAKFVTAAVDTGEAGEWQGAKAGDTVYFQVGSNVYSGKFDTDANTTLAAMLTGKSYTDTNGTNYNFTGAADGQATFTATSVGVATDPGIKTKASLAATGEKATISDGLANKLGTTADKGTDATTATTFAVKSTDNAGLTFQVGANQGDEMVINIEAMNCKSLGINSAKVSSQDSAASAIKVVDKAINTVSSQRAYLGAIQNRLGYKIANLNTSSQNLTSAESQIRDVDMAKEMTKFTNANILQQAATAMLAQANSLPQNVISLIR